MEIVDRTLLNETVATGADVVVRADLSNFHPVRGRITLNLTADGVLLAQRTVTVGVDARRSVYLGARFDTPGRYEIHLDGVSVGTVNVARATETATGSPTATRTPTSVSTRTLTPTLTPTTSGPEESPTEAPADSTPTDAAGGTVSIETTSGSGPGFGFGALIGTVAALAGWSAVRRERSD